MTKIFKTLETKLKIITKLRVFTIACSLVATVGLATVGGNSAVLGGSGAKMGGQQWGGGWMSSTFKNRSSHQSISPKQFQLKQS